MRTYSLSFLAAINLLIAISNVQARVVDWEAPPFSDHQMSLRCYLPDGLFQARAIIVLVPGMNGDGRSMSNDPQWMELAQRTGCALIGCYIKGSHGGSYYEVNHWSGDLFLKGLGELARVSNHSELNKAPLGFWGHSAGGEWNYNFACWKPQRTFAFIANKGAYYHGIATPSLREVPALWISGAMDTDERIGNITSLYAENRRRGAPWGLLIEPRVGHAIGRSKEIGIAFLEEALALRVDTTGQIKPVDPGAGWLADLQNNTLFKNPTPDFGAVMLTWLPGEKTSDLWKSIMLGSQPPIKKPQEIQVNQPNQKSLPK
jgi:hypothetical protein